MFCDQCMKPIIGDRFVYKADKNDNKKFCSQICCNEYYAPNCAECGKKAILGLHSSSKNDGKKFCSSACMNKHYDKETEKQASDFWAKYKGWIIGGGVVLVVLIVLGAIFSGSKKKRR